MKGSFTIGHSIYDGYSNNINLAIPWYLMASYLYYQRDISLISDAEYDEMCRDILENYPRIEHRHKYLVDVDALAAGTGFQIDWQKAPRIIIGAAIGIVEKEGIA